MQLVGCSPAGCGLLARLVGCLAAACGLLTAACGLLAASSVVMCHSAYVLNSRLDFLLPHVRHPF